MSACGVMYMRCREWDGMGGEGVGCGVVGVESLPAR